MVSLTCATDHRDGVTLVTARLEGSGVVQRVRLANRLDGPVWPPRRQGIPEAGWDEGCFETVVPADGTAAVGYASPAPAIDSPLAVVDREVVDVDTEEGSVTPADALRDLGDPSPPRDAVPITIGDSPDSSEQSTRTFAEESEQASTRQLDSPVPETVEAWLDDVEERVATAERLAAAETVPEATAAMSEAGSLEAAETLVETLRRDADALESVARRAERLAERTAAADVPLATFERIA